MTPTEAAAVAARQVPTGDRFVIDHLAHWVPDEPAASAAMSSIVYGGRRRRTVTSTKEGAGSPAICEESPVSRLS